MSDRSSSSATSVTPTTMASHGTIVGVIHLDSGADQRRRRGIVAVTASWGSRPDHTVSTSDATAGTPAPTAAANRSRHTRHISRCASTAHTSSAERSTPPRTYPSMIRFDACSMLMPAPSASRYGPGGHGS